MGVRRGIRFGVIALVLAVGSVLAACGGGTPPPEASESAFSATEHPTLHTLAEADLEPVTLELGEQIEKNEAFTTNAVTYTSGELSVTGALSVPTTAGPHPGLVLVHGVVDPDVYVPGSGLVREQAHFARAGYIVLSTDLRNATAEPDSAAALGIDLGSTLDVVNAVRALQASRIPTLDEQRIGLMGHSLGGLLTLNTIVAKPALVEAAVATAPASINPGDNVAYLTSTSGTTPTKVTEEYGTPESNPEFWSEMSPRGLVDRVEVPLLIAHGTADSIIPFEWSEMTVDVWRKAGKDVRFEALEGEDHVFLERWEEAMALTAKFLDAELSPSSPSR
ncbi:MAG: alpha/beta fold hydrolase [Homoserinimonas sp.]